MIGYRVAYHGFNSRTEQIIAKPIRFSDKPNLRMMQYLLGYTQKVASNIDQIINRSAKVFFLFFGVNG